MLAEVSLFETKVNVHYLQKRIVLLDNNPFLHLCSHYPIHDAFVPPALINTLRATINSTARYPDSTQTHHFTQTQTHTASHGQPQHTQHNSSTTPAMCTILETIHACGCVLEKQDSCWVRRRGRPCKDPLRVVERFDHHFCPGCRRGARHAQG